MTRDISFVDKCDRPAQGPMLDAALADQVVELSPEAILVYRRDKLTLLNQAATRLLGARSPSDIVGRSLFDFIDPQFHTLFDRRGQCGPAPGSPPEEFCEQIWMRVDGSRFPVEVAVTNLVSSGSPAVQVVVRDITERKRAEELQRGQNRILNMTATGAGLPEILAALARFIETQSAAGLCAIMQLNTEIPLLTNVAASTFSIDSATEVDSFTPSPCNGSRATAICHGEPVVDTDSASDPVWASKRESALRRGLRACASWPIFGKHRQVLGTIALYSRAPVAPSSKDRELLDICANLAAIAIESRASEERMRHLAHYDGLTALPNRFLFKDHLDLAVRNAKRHGTKFAVFFLDLDKFKEINDTFGHEAGDQVLREVASRLRGCLRHTDKIARMGGDEFYILIEDLADSSYAADVARKLLQEASRPLWVHEEECQVSGSIGIAVYPNDGAEADTLLKNADNAMYCAKNAGRNAYRFYAAGTGSSKTVDPHYAQG